MGEIKCQEGSSVRLPLPQPSRSQLVETQLAQLQAKNKALEEESLGFWMFLLKTVLFPFSFFCSDTLGCKKVNMQHDCDDDLLTTSNAVVSIDSPTRPRNRRLKAKMQETTRVPVSCLAAIDSNY